MTIKTGDTLPNATLLQMADDGPKQVALADKLENRKVVIVIKLKGSLQVFVMSQWAILIILV